jgi:outer membrane protein OmpA-like peptidoglycan-associated protein
MSSTRLAAAVFVTMAACLAAACGPLRLRAPEGRADADLIMLVPDPGGGVTGGAAVSNGAGSVVLDDTREFTVVGGDGRPTRVRVMAESEVKRLFGDVLATLPPAPEHFTLFFRFESDELTDESRSMVPGVLQALKNRPVPEISVVGHTDTTGTPASNVDLGMKRANTVRALLVQAGLDPSSVEVTSHGEAVLLVGTPDETYEPRNRRVEITIR